MIISSCPECGSSSPTTAGQRVAEPLNYVAQLSLDSAAGRHVGDVQDAGPRLVRHRKHARSASPMSSTTAPLEVVAAIRGD
jgi:hypothetical protein